MKFPANPSGANGRGARASARFSVGSFEHAEHGLAVRQLKRRERRAPQAGFTLAEVLAALMFMAIVIPVAMQGLHIASRAGAVAERKREAARVAERVLNENLAMTNMIQSAQSGVVQELDRQYRWSLRSERWTEATMQLLTVEVAFPVQGQDYTVELSTLAELQ